jgi:hypothetical protein
LEVRVHVVDEDRQRAVAAEGGVPGAVGVVAGRREAALQRGVVDGSTDRDDPSVGLHRHVGCVVVVGEAGE